ncbi:MAG: DUF3109 family protein [Leptolyngbya sp. SIO3F4]|nr:DUF3109 family protein [Leptolyngbya sp. SIO3F4]
MIEVGRALIHPDLLQEKFVCDLAACKGACCVEGDAGAPLEEEELALLDENQENIRPFLRPEGIAALEAQGNYIRDIDGEWVTPLVDGKECAYTTFDTDGTAHCGIEQAHRAGATDFRKPLSCHLYPVRIQTYRDFDAVNYDRWDICKPACACGSELNVKVFRFVKDALIRKYGGEWYAELETIDREWSK